MIFDDFGVDKGATMETFLWGILSLFLQATFYSLWTTRFERMLLRKMLLIVDFRSLPEKPRQDEQDFTVVEQYPLAPT